MHGHADHFLSRLDRISPAETELALSLYRDPAMLRQIIEIVRPDPSRERVAISLGGDDGPFVIVTRDARFITCLGRGMQTYDAAVVPREDLARCESALARLRAVMADARGVPVEQRHERAAFGSLFRDGDRVRREDLAHIQRVQPLMLPALFETYARMNLQVRDMLAELRYRAAFRVDERPRLRALWQGAWAVAHLTTLLASDALVLTHRYAEDGASLGEFFADVSGAGAHLGNTAFSLRSHWAAAQMAPVCIDRLEAMARVTVADVNGPAALWSLLGAGVRHPELADRAIGCLESLASSPMEYIAYLAPTLATLLRDRLDRGDEWERRAVATLRRGTYSGGGHEQWDGYDDDAVVTWHANVEVGLRTDDDAEPLLGLLVPWYAARGASMMCQPEAVVRRLQPPWELGASENLVAHHRALWKAREPRRVAAAPGRNDPCPCGSGAKFKKCCG